MFDKTKLEVNSLADAANFNRNTTEKVLRLYSILQFFDSSDLRLNFVLKGGTAINLFLLDLPRLSVDIDLDFNMPIEKPEMLEKRKHIDKQIKLFMEDEGYLLSNRSKFVHSLDSYVYLYETLSGSNDVLKIEINYSDRVHVLEPERSESTKKLGQTISFNRLSDEELIGSKINALLVRTTPRDVYDVYNLFKGGFIKNATLIRKIAIFYVCLGSQIPIDFYGILNNALKRIKELTFQKIKQTLIPVVHKGISFDVEEVTNYVYGKIKYFFNLDEKDLSFIKGFNDKHFIPEVLFEGIKTKDVRNHPMGIWKTKE